MSALSINFIVQPSLLVSLQSEPENVAAAEGSVSVGYTVAVYSAR